MPFGVRKVAGGTLVEPEQDGKGRRPVGNIDPLEVLLIAVVALLLFGVGRIVDIGKGMGEGLREANGDAARNATIAFAVALAICWLAVSAARHR